MYLNHEVPSQEHIFVPNIKPLMYNQYMLHMHVLQRYMYLFVNLNNFTFGDTYLSHLEILEFDILHCKYNILKKLYLFLETQKAKSRLNFLIGNWNS